MLVTPPRKCGAASSHGRARRDPFELREYALAHALVERFDPNAPFDFGLDEVLVVRDGRARVSREEAEDAIDVEDRDSDSKEFWQQNGVYLTVVTATILAGCITLAAFWRRAAFSAVVDDAASLANATNTTSLSA